MTKRRTDLAIEINENLGENVNGIKKFDKKNGDVSVCKIEILNSSAAEKLGKPIGKYITVEFPSVDKIDSFDEIKDELITALRELLPEKYNNILVVGLGNDEITSDSIGPNTAKRLLATRHIAGEFAENIGLKGLNSV